MSKYPSLSYGDVVEMSRCVMCSGWRNGYRDSQIGTCSFVWCCVQAIGKWKRLVTEENSAEHTVVHMHLLYAWPRALVMKVWTYDVMGWIGSEAGVGSRFWCERAQGLGLTAGVPRLEDTESICVILHRNRCC